MKDVLVFVMGEMAKESDTDFKFQMPKHTSFVGSIIKNVGIEVISRNESYRNFLAEHIPTEPAPVHFDQRGGHHAESAPRHVSDHHDEAGRDGGCK